LRALTREQKKNIHKTQPEPEGVMQEIFYDVVSLMTMSGFLVMAAVWIGAL
jgi:hypothetical protein